MASTIPSVSDVAGRDSTAPAPTEGRSTDLHASATVLLIDAARRLAAHFMAVALGEPEETAAEYCRWCLMGALRGEPVAHTASCLVGEVLRAAALLEDQAAFSAPEKNIPLPDLHLTDRCSSVCSDLRCSLKAGHELPHSSAWGDGSSVRAWTDVTEPQLVLAPGVMTFGELRRRVGVAFPTMRSPRLDAFGNPSRERHTDHCNPSTEETEVFWHGSYDARPPLVTGHGEREIVLDAVVHPTPTEVA